MNIRCPEIFLPLNRGARSEIQRSQKVKTMNKMTCDPVKLTPFLGLRNRRACIPTGLVSWTVLLMSLCAQGAFAAGTETKSPLVESSVVKILATVRYPDYFKPWTKEAPREIVGSGVVIEGKRILSNAHLALYASQIEVQANESGDKFSAKVEAVAPGVDLAVIKLDDETFFNAHPPLPRAGNLPAIKDAVLAYGYPEGGTTLSITRGIVSRIEFTSYNYPVFGLMIQVDAAVNPGNSGGPVMAGDKMIGLAFRVLASADNIAYVIPTQEIELFLTDIADGHYDGKPALYESTQTLENPALRPFLKLDKTVTGTLVHQPFRSEPEYPLKEWDLITKIGDVPVDNQGKVTIENNLRVDLRYLVQKFAKDGKVPLTIIRGGKQMQVQVPVSPTFPGVLPSSDGAYPSYFVFGPMVFTAANRDLIGSIVEGQYGATLLLRLAAVGNPLLCRFGEKQRVPGEGLVIVSSPFFPTKLVTGYDNPVGQVVKTINGHPVHNLAALVELLRDCRDEFIAIEFEQRGAETLVFSRSELLAATDDILSDNGLRSQGSADMLAIWNAKAPKGSP